MIDRHPHKHIVYCVLYGTSGTVRQTKTNQRSLLLSQPMSSMFLSPRIIRLLLIQHVSLGFSVRPFSPRPHVPNDLVASYHQDASTVATTDLHKTSRTKTATLNAMPPSFPLIASDDTWGNWATLASTASLAQYLGKSTRIGRLLGPPVSAMAITFVLATIGVLNPGGTAAARSLQLLSLQLATPLILLGADLRDAWRRCGPLLASFLVASMATLLACLAGWSFIGSQIESALGRDGLVIAASLMAKNIGGGLN